MMRKSVYSLTLFDEIVEQIDQIAYENKTNRSQLINDILADYIGVQTPEQKIQTVLETLDQNLDGVLSVSQICKNNSIQFGKSLKYKYRPKIHYCYEFKNDDGKKYAVLKISSRTKNEDLNQHFSYFFHYIDSIEHRHQQEDCDNGGNTSQHKFVRAFKHYGAVTQDIRELTDFLTRYLLMIDTAMNAYFSVDGEGNIDEKLDGIYSHYLDEN